MKILLTLLIFVSFSYAGLSDFLKEIKEATKQPIECSRERFDECKAKFWVAWQQCDNVFRCFELNQGNTTFSEDSFSRCQTSFSGCQTFVERCECWAKTKQKEPSGQHYEHPSNTESRIESFQIMKSTVLKNKSAMEAEIAQKQELARKDSIRLEAERQEKARVDSIRQESYSEIYTLIGNGAETSLILNKCAEYAKTFYKGLPVPACTSIRDSVNKQQEITEITALLKANKLEECLDGCKRAKFSSDEKIMDMCEKQLISKIKKLPLKKINSVSLAEIYYEDQKITNIAGYVFQNDGKMLLMDDLVWGNTIMVQYAAGYIGDCRLRPNRQIPFGGYAKYLGDKVYTTVLGVRQSVPNYQLLWCR